MTRNRVASTLVAWASSEPVRLRIYAAMTPVLALLVARGILSDSDVPYAAAAILAILGISGTESARARVTPWAPPGPSLPLGKHTDPDQSTDQL